MAACAAHLVSASLMPLGLSIIMGYGRHQGWCIRAAYAACVVASPPLWLLGNWRHNRVLLAQRVAGGSGALTGVNAS